MKLTGFDYDSIPPGYYDEVLTKGSSGHQFWHRQKFALVAREMPAGPLTILDVGCGPGSFFSVLAGLREEDDCRLGCDLSVGQLSYASGQEIEASWIAADASSLPIADDSVDLVTMVEVLEHFPPALEAAVLRECYRVLRPGGRIVLTTPNYRSLWPAIEWLWEMMSPVKYGDQHINRKNLATLRRSMEQAGFRVERCDSFFVLSPLAAVLSVGFGEWMQDLEWRFLKKIGAICLATGTVVPSR